MKSDLNWFLHISKGLFTWREGAPANRATRLEGLKHSPPLHATQLTGTVSGLRELSLEQSLSTTNITRRHVFAVYLTSVSRDSPARTVYMAKSYPA